MSSIPSMPLKVSNGFSSVALKLTAGDQHPPPSFFFAVDPFFERAGRDLDHVRQAVIIVVAGPGEIFETLWLTAGVLASSAADAPRR